MPARADPIPGRWHRAIRYLPPDIAQLFCGPGGVDIDQPGKSPGQHLFHIFRVPGLARRDSYRHYCLFADGGEIPSGRMKSAYRRASTFSRAPVYERSSWPREGCGPLCRIGSGPSPSRPSAPCPADSGLERGSPACMAACAMISLASKIPWPPTPTRTMLFVTSVSFVSSVFFPHSRSCSFSPPPTTAPAGQTCWHRPQPAQSVSFILGPPSPPQWPGNPSEAQLAAFALIRQDLSGHSYPLLLPQGAGRARDDQRWHL